MSRCGVSFMNVLQDLLDEHATIVRTVAVLGASAKKIEGGKELPPDFFIKMFEVLTVYVDKCHHSKEEVALFPRVLEASTKERDMVSVLLEEHEKGRAHVRAMREAVNKKDSAGLAKSINEYDALLIQHIKKENLTFPKWMNMFSDEAKRDMSEKFEEVEVAAMGARKHQEYAVIVEGLKKSIQ
jgi:hemerythrin-like domain-containing protein